MKTLVAIYKTQEDATKALNLLKEKEYSKKEISILSKAIEKNNHIHHMSLDQKEMMPSLIGAGAGTIIGALAGLGIFTIPGFGFLYGAGAIIGAIGGFDVGLVSGGIVTLLAMMGIHEDLREKYETALHEGKWLLIIHTKKARVLEAEKIISKLNNTDLIEII